MQIPLSIFLLVLGIILCDDSCSSELHEHDPEHKIEDEFGEVDEFL